MSEEHRKPIWPLIVALLIGLPVLYVLSSGPMQTLAFRSHVSFVSTPPSRGSMGVAAVNETDMGKCWPVVFAPLLWASEQSWGELLNWYWELFPIPDAK